MCVNHPKTLTSQKLSSPLSLFGFKSFRECVILGGRIVPTAYLVFYLVMKMREHLYKKPNQKWQTTVKTFKQNQNVLTVTHKKRQILFHRFLGEYTKLLTPSLFYGGMGGGGAVADG